MRRKFFSFFGLFIVSLAAIGQVSVFESRRSAIMEMIGNECAIIKNSGRDYVLSANVNWNYYYLTGDSSADAILLVNGLDKTAAIYKKQTSGRRTSQTNEPAGIEIKSSSDFERDLNRMLFRTKNLWTDFAAMPQDELANLRLDNLEAIKNISAHIHSMRKIKDDHEMELLSHAIQTTAKGLVEVMKAAEPGMNEKDFELILDYCFGKEGCEYLGFGIQAASGPNSTLVHYGANNRETKAGDMMVFDVGSRSGFYSGDISRSFPVSGKFTKEQKDIYSLVLEAQKTAISKMLPGESIGAASNSAVEVLNNGLARLGLITDLNSPWQKRFWIQHGFFHHIGLVVHDVGGYSGNLEPGMILTMEPGLYFPEGYLENASARGNIDKDELESFLKAVTPVFERYINIGVRIEDDVYITETGNKVISAGVPKEINDIEELMKKNNQFSPKK